MDGKLMRVAFTKNLFLLFFVACCFANSWVSAEANASNPELLRIYPGNDKQVAIVMDGLKIDREEPTLPGMLFSGDELITDERSKADVKFPVATVTMQRNTKARITDQSNNIILENGGLVIETGEKMVKSKGKSASFKITLDGFVVQNLLTNFYVGVDSERNIIDVSVARGEVKILSKEKKSDTWVIKAGNRRVIIGNKMGKEEQLSGKAIRAIRERDYSPPDSAGLEQESTVLQAVAIPDANDEPNLAYVGTQPITRNETEVQLEDNTILNSGNNVLIMENKDVVTYYLNTNTKVELDKHGTGITLHNGELLLISQKDLNIDVNGVEIALTGDNVNWFGHKKSNNDEDLISFIHLNGVASSSIFNGKQYAPVYVKMLRKEGSGTEDLPVDKLNEIVDWVNKSSVKKSRESLVIVPPVVGGMNKQELISKFTNYSLVIGSSVDDVEENDFIDGKYLFSIDKGTPVEQDTVLELKRMPIRPMIIGIMGASK